MVVVPMAQTVLVLAPLVVVMTLVGEDEVLVGMVVGGMTVVDVPGSTCAQAVAPIKTRSAGIIPNNAQRLIGPPSGSPHRLISVHKTKRRIGSGRYVGRLPGETVLLVAPGGATAFAT